MIKKSIFIGAFILAFLTPTLFGAGNVYVYSDGACPAGTTASGKFVQVIKTKAHGLVSVSGGTGCGPGNQPPSYVQCFAASTGTNLKCHELSGVAYVGAWYCYYTEITYDSLALCRWDLP